MNHIALCRGQDLTPCHSCLRNADRYPAAAVATHKAWINPTNRENRCTAWKPAPATAHVEHKEAR